MTNTPYEVRAYRFAQTLCRLFEECSTLEDFEWAIRQYNRAHSIPLHYDYGVSRIAIIRSDYVIKFNIAPTGDWDDGEGGCRAGNNSSEEEVYNRAVRDGFAHLLAKTTVVRIMGRDIAIMPRIYHVGDTSRCYYQYMTKEERDWVADNIYDVHCWNVGYYNNKPVIIDYGWDGGAL